MHFANCAKCVSLLHATRVTLSPLFPFAAANATNIVTADVQLTTLPAKRHITRISINTRARHHRDLYTIVAASSVYRSVVVYLSTIIMTDAYTYFRSEIFYFFFAIIQVNINVSR